MGRILAALKSIFRQPLSLIFRQSSPKPSLSRDASLSLAKINTSLSQQVYTNKDQSFKIFKKIYKNKQKREKKLLMSHSEPGPIPGLALNPEAGAFTAREPEE